MASSADDDALQAAYEEAVAYVFRNARLALGTHLAPPQLWERFEGLLDALGRPHDGFRVIHLAGTNGKGTASALCDSMLRAAGESVGLFTSPHLHSFRERIRINGELVSRRAVVDALTEIRAHCDAAGELAPFEKLTALAFVCFRAAGVRWLVLETGLGGLWDATNHVRAPALAAVGICRIGLDHTAVLGPTIEAIAKEKAGIIKGGGEGGAPPVPAFTVPQRAAATAVLADAAVRARAPLITVNGSHGAVLRAERLWAREQQRQWEAEAGQPTPPRAPSLPLWLQPEHQRCNMALAVCLVATALGVDVGGAGAADADAEPSAAAAAAAAAEEGETALDRLLLGALRTTWPGRLESVRVLPAQPSEGAAARALQFDCAHNEDAVRALLHHLAASSAARAAAAADPTLRPPSEAGGAAAATSPGAPPAGPVLVFGANRDKETRTLLDLIGAFAAGRPVELVAPPPASAHAAAGAGSLADLLDAPPGGGGQRAAAQGSAAAAAEPGGAPPAPRVPRVLLVASTHPKSSEPGALLEVARSLEPSVRWEVAASVADAVDEATAGGPDGAQPWTVFFGSVFVVAEARARLARTHPHALRPGDWAFEQDREPQLQRTTATA